MESSLSPRRPPLFIQPNFVYAIIFNPNSTIPTFSFSRTKTSHAIPPGIHSAGYPVQGRGIFVETGRNPSFLPSFLRDVYALFIAKVGGGKSIRIVWNFRARCLEALIRSPFPAVPLFIRSITLSEAW